MSFSRDGLGFQRRKKSMRSKGEAPTMGPIARMHKNALSLRERLSYAGRVPLILLALAVFSFGAGITGLVLWVAGSASKRNPVIFTPTLAPRAGPVEQLAPVPEPAELEAIVQRFLAARTSLQLESLIRGSHQRPEEITAKLAGLEEIDGRIESVRYKGPVKSLCLQLESVEVRFDSGRNRLALMAPDPRGTWRVDFDAFDRYVHPAWDELLAGTPAEGLVRVFVSPDNYYNGLYVDDKAWACCGFASADHKTLMFGYAKRGSSQHLAMAEALRSGAAAGLKRMTLEIRHTGSGDRRQFEIVRVLADEWAVGDEPLDARFAAEAAAKD